MIPVLSDLFSRQGLAYTSTASVVSWSGLTAEANQSADQAGLTVRARFGGGVHRRAGQHESDDHAGDERAIHLKSSPLPTILPKDKPTTWGIAVAPTES